MLNDKTALVCAALVLVAGLLIIGLTLLLSEQQFTIALQSLLAAPQLYLLELVLMLLSFPVAGMVYWQVAMRQRRFPMLEKDLAQLRYRLLREVSSLNFGEVDNLEPVFAEVLETILRSTGSEYGFIGKVLRDVDGKPSLSTVAMTDISWDAATAELYRPTGMMFTNLDTLFGAVLVSEQTLIANTPEEHASAGGIPKGHPPLKSFLGIPVKVGGGMIGMVGVANRPGGYNEVVLNQLSDTLDLCAQLIKLLMTSIDHKESAQRYQRIYDDGPVMTVLSEAVDGMPVVVDCNRKFCERLGYARDEVIGRSLADFYDSASAELLIDQFSQSMLEGVRSVRRTLIARDGSRLYTRVDAVPNDVGGKPGTHVTFLDVTEEHGAVLDSTRSMVSLENALSSAGIGYFTFDPQDNIALSGNSVVETLTGYGAQDLPPDLVGQMKGELMLVESDSGSDLIEKVVTVEKKDGKKTELLVSRFSADSWSSGDMSNLVILRPVRAGEKDAIRSRQLAMQMARFVDLASAPVIGVNADGIISVWNQAAVNLTGINMTDALGRNLVDELLTENSSAVARIAVSRVLQDGESPAFEMSLKASSGAGIDLIFNLVPRINMAGEVTGALGVGQDVTELKLARAEAERAAQELRQFFDTANSPIFGTDEKGLVNEWNHMMQHVSGIAASQISGQNFLEVVREEDRERIAAVLGNALQGVEASAVEFGFESDSGTYPIVVVNVTTRRNIDGEIIGVLVMGQDVTELRLRQEETSRTQRLKALGQLTGGIAHDFNNLLTIIQGNLKYLQDGMGGDPEDLAEVIDDALSAAFDGSNLTRQLLAFARQQRLKPVEVEVTELLEKSTRMISRTMGEDVVISYEPYPGKLIARVDPAQLEVALLNLCINARDAMNDVGDIVVRTGLKQVDAKPGSEVRSGLYVFVAVADTGSGIALEDQARVFEPFFSAKETGKGTGLGLSMVQGFAGQSKGMVDLQSIPGEGTTITLFLPAIQVADGQLAETGIQDQHELDLLLVVEDEDRIRRFAVRTLKRLGYNVIDAAGVAEAKRVLAKVPNIKTVFSDIVMPGDENGRDLEVYVRLNYPDIKILMTSGYEDPGIETVEENADNVLKKPYSSDELKAALEELENESHGG